MPAAAAVAFFVSCQGSDKRSSESAASPEGVGLEVAVPLTTEQAAALEGVRAGVRAGVRGEAKEGVRGAEGDEVVADATLDGQAVAEGVRGGVRAGVQGGVRGGVRAGAQEGVRGGVRGVTGRDVGTSGRRDNDSPDSTSRLHDLTTSRGTRRQPALDLAFVAEVPLAPDLLRAGERRLGFRVRTAPQGGGTPPPLIELQTTIQIQTPPAGESGTPLIVEKTISSGEVFLPDADGDGISTLVEVAVFASIGDIQTALANATDAGSRPTESQAQEAFGTFSKVLQTTLSDQGVTTPVVLGPVDLTPPDTAAVSSKQSAVSGEEIVFTLSCNEPSCVFQCSLDGSEFLACSSPFTFHPSPEVGQHTLRVFASDSLGNRDPTPAALTFEVLPPPTDIPTSAQATCGNGTCETGEDSATCLADCPIPDRTAPETTITAKPSAVGNQTSATFAFSCSDVGAASSDPPSCTFECSLDSTSFSSCTSPFTLHSLPEGAHAFSVRAADAAGNVDATPASHSWTVDTTAPPVVIGSKPSALSNSTSPSFTFSSSDAGAAFSCKLDQPGLAGAYTSCTFPLTLSLSKGDGAYTFTVQATDAAGNAGSASHTWTLDTTGPPVSGAMVTPGNRQVTVSWNAATDPLAGGQVPGSGLKDYDAAYCSPSPCSLPSTPQATALTTTSLSVTGLTNCTAYDFFVRARDNLGNVGAWASVTSIAPAVDAPAAPTVIGHPWELQIAWSSVANASGYVLYHHTASFANKGVATAVSVTGTEWDLGFANSAVRYVRVTAKDGACESALSSEVSFSPLGTSNFALFTFTGDVETDRLGFSAATAGDVNADGKDDLVVGADYADSDASACPTVATNRGVARVINGSTGAVLYTFCGQNAGDRFGYAVASAGDVNADGKADVLITAPEGDSEPTYCSSPLSDRGYLRVYSGSSGALLYAVCGVAAWDDLGVSVAGVPDSNGDGKDDFVVGIPLADTEIGCGSAADRGAARLYSGANGSTLLQKYCGELGNDRYGDAVSGAGDFDGDGLGDFLVGAYLADQDTVSAACPSPLADRGTVQLYNALGGIAMTKCGPAAGDWFGASVASAGDVNGDGKDDVIVGAPKVDSDGSACPTSLTDRGAAYVHAGPTGTLLYAICGDAGGDLFGTSVAGAGDVNGDGRGDFIVAAPDADSDPVACPAGASERGVVRVYSGADAQILARFCGDAANDYFGWSVGSAGDINTDGRPELIIGAYLADATVADAGKAYVFRLSQGIAPPFPAAIKALSVQLSAVSPASSTYSWTILKNNSATASITASGSPVTYTAGSTAGIHDSVRLTDAKNRSWDTPAFVLDHTLASGWPKTGDVDSDNLGISVASAGDVNGDGRADVIVGAHRADSDSVACPSALTNRGIARVFSGADGSILLRFCGDAPNDLFGYSVSTAGDVNGDGRADLIVGARWADSDSYACPVTVLERGIARIFSGANGSVLYRFCGDATSDYFGYSVSAAGDVNGDGKDDVIVGAYGADSDATACSLAATDRGIARVFSGADGSILYRLCGDVAGDYFGVSVSAAGDVNRDGKADVIVGADLADSDPSACAASVVDRGIARVFSGADGSILHRFCGDATNDWLGVSVTAAGDVNGDGRADVIVGAYGADSDATACPTPAGERGIARVFSGSDGSILHRFCGDSAGDEFGYSVSSAGDPSGDGKADVMVGAWKADSDSVACSSALADRGIARVFSGGDGSVLYRFCGEALGDEFGGSVSSSGDVDLDGRSDLVVGAYTADTGNSDAGKAYLYVSTSQPVAVKPPTMLAVSALTSSSVTLTWAENATNETGYCIEYRKPTYGWATASCSVAPNATSAPVSGLTGSTRYHFRVKVFNASADSPWSNIAKATTGGGASVTVTSPNGGESWDAFGGPQNITWTTTGTLDSTVDLHYSTDSGQTWTVIALGEANDGTYAWTLPVIYSTTCRVRITVYESGAPFADTSNANFTITYPS
ncbi:MAG: FG-GAP repeat protein [Nitrospirae bacterium]|nr:FG-GAP repeat protein [Nitrospirota bacterium]